MTIEELLAKNRAYVAARPVIPPGAVPTAGLTVLTCMDTRIDPLAVLGLHLGEAHILRNAGARVTPDVIRSLAVSQQVLQTRMVLVMAHSGCGMIGLDASKSLEPWQPGAQAPMDWRTVVDIAQAVTEDLTELRQSPWIGREVVLVGTVFDLDSAAVRLVAQR